MSGEADDFFDRMHSDGLEPPPGEKASARRIRALVSNNQVDYAHADVANAAWFFKERIGQAFARGKRYDGIFPDMIASVTMTAFALEGYVNVVGVKLIERKHPENTEDAWSRLERKPIYFKIKAICRMTGARINWNKRPYSTIQGLTTLRSMFAHPKAHRPEKREFEAVGTEEELRQMLRDYRPEYERRLTPEFVETAYADVAAIWSELLSFANIEPSETWSGGSQGIEFLEHVDGPGEG